MLIYQRSDSATALTAGENAWRIKEPSASVECRHCVQTENLTPTYERPALRKLLAAFPAESKVAAASFAVMATVVSISDRLPPAAAASTVDASDAAGRSLAARRASHPLCRCPDVRELRPASRRRSGPDGFYGSAVEHSDRRPCLGARRHQAR